ncbi:acetoacetate decarboxylase family protein [Litoribacillus peritrichatus]|uniref:Acetoacetate decarboxylase n=1 Tax=Litoribacillus peritrichatus TaxID=718191 RepID=A0ABP7MIC7_9GAMM
MQANTNFSPELLDNESQFQDEFFKRFELRHRDSPLQLTDDISKNYRFPTFYGDSSCAIAIFHCDYEAAKAIMPHPSMQPVKMTRGRSLVIFSCYEYRNVMNVAPYNEIAMTIPVVVDGALNIPVLTMLAGDKLKNFGYHVFHMPVTSLENRIRGRKIWGLPKDLETIEISKASKSTTIKASVPGQAPYLELNIPTSGTTQQFDVHSNLYSVLEGRRLKSETNFKSSFVINKNMATLFKKSPTNQQNQPLAALRLGEGPVADKLRSLKIESEAFQYRYTPSMNACFDLPKGE